MYTEEDLDAAVASGVVTRDAMTALREHTAMRHHTSVVDEEHFRLVSGFNDIFVVIASLLLLAAVGWIGVSAGPSVSPVVAGVAVGAVAWGLSEFFVRRRQMALPAIVLLLVFTGSAAFIGTSLVSHLLHAQFEGQGEVGLSRYATVIVGGLVALAAWAQWWRFKVPMAVAVVTAALLGTALSLAVALVPSLGPWLTLLMFVAGCVAFAVALRWDASDARRRTRRSDVAFWLHLLAAPLLVHPVFKEIGLFSQGIGAWQAVLVVALYVAIAVTSLAIDRRALMVSALGYVLYAFTMLLKQAGVVSLGFAITALVIGAVLLLLSAFWHHARRICVGRLPIAWQRRLPPLGAA